MKKLLLFALVLLGFACSAPKQYYMFNQKTTPAPIKEAESEIMVTKAVEVNEPSPIILEEEELMTQVATVDVEEVEMPAEAPKVMTKEEFKSLSRTEKKELKKEVRKMIRSAKSDESVESTKELNLSGYTKIGAILIVAGIVLQIFSVFGYLGSVLVLAGVIFILIDIL